MRGRPRSYKDLSDGAYHAACAKHSSIKTLKKHMRCWQKSFAHTYTQAFILPENTNLHAHACVYACMWHGPSTSSSGKSARQAVVRSPAEPTRSQETLCQAQAHQMCGKHNGHATVVCPVGSGHAARHEAQPAQPESLQRTPGRRLPALLE
eukprot:365318-Chlamydomonas_euryale.AAC.12